MGGAALPLTGAFTVEHPVTRLDVFRSPDNQHLVRETMNAGQRRAYGTMLAMLEVA